MKLFIIRFSPAFFYFLPSSSVIFLIILFSHTHTLCYLVSVKYEVSHPHKIGSFMICSMLGIMYYMYMCFVILLSY